MTDQEIVLQWCRLAARRATVVVLAGTGAEVQATLLGYDARRQRCRVQCGGGPFSVKASAVLEVLEGGSE